MRVTSDDVPSPCHVRDDAITPSIAPGHLEEVAAGAELGAVTFGEADIDVH